MDTEPRPSLGQWLKNLIIGKARSPTDRSVFHKLSLVAFFAWVGMGADGLSSSAYGPAEAFLALGNHTYLAVFVALATVLTVFVISAGYSQIIELFPTGGGGYLVASKLLSPAAGMVAGAALLVDYVLTITVSIASGADALFSFLPPAWLPYRLTFAVLGVAGLTLLNLRGVRESVVPLVPVFLIFILTHAFAILFSVADKLPHLGETYQTLVQDTHSARSELGLVGMILLMLRAYSMGAGTYTGIEAVSNGLPLLRDPKVVTGKRTMSYMAWSLAIVVMGLMVAYLFYGVSFQPGKTLNAVLFDRLTAGWPAGLGQGFVWTALFSEAAILFVAAQTGFFGGPRVLANMALDRWAPSRFAMLSDRLVSQNGILIMGTSAAAMMLFTGGSVKVLVVLYAINVFITFVLSQLGMVRHWWAVRARERRWGRRILINGVGLVLTSFILIMVIVLKFNEGGWITLLVTGSLIAVVLMIKRHYRHTSRLLSRLDSLVMATSISTKGPLDGITCEPEVECFDPNAKTAVLMVNGFNGLGLHTTLSVVRLFGQSFRNFVFVQVGVVDAGVFKGVEAVQALKKEVDIELQRYVTFMQHHGYYAESVSSIGTDVVTEVTKIAPQVLERFPQAIFFGGQLVFPEDSILTRWLHNYTAFAMQRSFYYQGIPVVILPIRV
jgi:amino acid transporter